MPRAKKKPAEGTRESNAELVARVMEFPKSGPLMQVFIVEALRRYADECAAASPDKMNFGPINGHAWKRCAVELQFELLKHLGE